MSRRTPATRAASASVAPAAPALDRAAWLYAAAIALACGLAYANGLTGPFILDDQLAVVENLGIREWWKLATVLSPERELPTAGRPLVNLTFALNYAWGGLDVVGYHAVNILCHLATSLLLFGVVRRTLRLDALRDRFGDRATGIACATALLWSVHPLNTEAVDYVTERTELLMALCYLATLYASLRALRPSRLWAATAIVACAGGMACKESMVTAPVMIGLFDAVFVFGSWRTAVRERWRLYLGLAATWLVLGAAIWSGPRVHSAGLGSGVSPWTYLLNQPVVIVEYLRRVVWPRDLVINYGFPVPVGLGDVWPQGLLVVGLLAATVALLAARPFWGFLGAWFFVTLAPTSSLVPIATEVGAERRMYLPLVSLVALGVVAVAARMRPSRTAGTAMVAVVGLLLAAGTFARNREYQSSLMLARTVVDRYPTPVAHHILGASLIEAGDVAGGMAELRRALPGDARAHFTIGSQLMKGGDYPGAIAAFEAFLREKPFLLEAVSARQMLGQALIKERRWADAAAQERLVLTMNPTSVERTNALGLLGDALLGAGDPTQAIAPYQAYLRARPDDVAGLGHLGVALIAADRLEEATAAFRRAVALDPRNADAQRNLANALFDAGNYSEALVHADAAAAARPSDPDAHDLLGRCLALAGRFAEARAHFERALEIDPAHAEARDDLRKLAQIMRTPAR